MIPVTTEDAWLTLLSDIAGWQPPAASTLVIAPHPDDETLGAGGLINTQRRRGIGVRVAAVTDGEAAYGDTPGLAGTRRGEQLRALGELGVAAGDVIRFSFPDGKVSDYEDQLVARLETLIRGDTLVIAPWEYDPHPDHESCGRAARRVAESRGATLVSYFFWAWHWRPVASLASLQLVRLELDAEVRETRARALSHHRSQLERESGAPILPDLLLAPARRSFETFLRG